MSRTEFGKMEEFDEGSVSRAENQVSHSVVIEWEIWQDDDDWEDVESEKFVDVAEEGDWMEFGQEISSEERPCDLIGPYDPVTNANTREYSVGSNNMVGGSHTAGGSCIQENSHMKRSREGDFMNDRILNCSTEDGSEETGPKYKEMSGMGSAPLSSSPLFPVPLPESYTQRQARVPLDLAPSAGKQLGIGQWTPRPSLLSRGSRDHTKGFAPGLRSRFGFARAEQEAAGSVGAAVETAAKKLVQGTLTAFLGVAAKFDKKVVGEGRKVQADIGSYFGLKPLNPEKGASAGGLRNQTGASPGVESGDSKRLKVSAGTAVKGGKQRGRGWGGWGANGSKGEELNSKGNLPGGSIGANGKQNRAPRLCPFYKKMPGTSFTVDAFKFGAIPDCTAYFLTHFHSDHYGGLTKSWSHGPIFCTPVTARLVALCLRVDQRWLRPIKMGSTIVVDGVEVTPVPANHCPGAALFLFRLPSGSCILHTGDFRACREMQEYPHLRDCHISSLYLDTTYCNPKYCFPPQEDVIRFAVATAKAAMANNPRTLVAVGSYSVGKERVFLAIAQALGVKIFVDQRRKRVLEALDWPELACRLTTDGNSTPLHVLPLGTLHHQRVRAYLQQFQPRRNALLGFRPTGWTYSEKVGSDFTKIKPSKSGVITVYGVPYSEHSSFAELREFIQFFRPGKIIPTVNVGSVANREQMQSHFNQWLRK